MPKVRIVRGTYNPLDGERAGPGDVVEVSQERLDGWPNNRYEVISDDAADLESADDADGDDGEGTESTDEQDAADSDPEDEAAADAATDGDEEDGEAEPDVEMEFGDVSVDDIIPYDDYRTLATMAKHYDGDDVHGAMAGEEITDFFETLSVPEVQDLKRKAEGELSGGE